jgi:glycosyltransferase involved in cell wall biosynthesis
MNYGLPVLASENIEQEIIGDAGLIYRNNDPNELAEKIIYLFENEKERKKLSNNAKKRLWITIQKELCQRLKTYITIWLDIR